MGIQITPDQWFQEMRRTGEYSNLLALCAAEHAFTVYRDDYPAVAEASGWESSSLIRLGGVEIGLSWNLQQGGLVIAVRGSEPEANDWFANARSLWRREWPGVLAEGATVGVGFRNRIERIWPMLREEIEFTMPKGGVRNLLITGHSQGAALAYLLATRMRTTLSVETLARRPVVYGFEPPRVGNRQWAKAYARAAPRSFTIANVKNGVMDIVTRLPKKAWGFRHVGEAVIHDGYRTFFGQEEWDRYRARNPVGHIAGWRLLSRLWSGVLAHSSEEILPMLRKKVAAQLRSA